MKHLYAAQAFAPVTHHRQAPVPPLRAGGRSASLLRPALPRRSALRAQLAGAFQFSAKAATVLTSRRTPHAAHAAKALAAAAPRLTNTARGVRT